MSDKQKPVTREEAVRMVAAYVSLARKDVEDTDIELVKSVEAMVDEGRQVPTELAVLAEVIGEEIERVRKVREVMRKTSEVYVSKWVEDGHIDLIRYKGKDRDRKKAQNKEEVQDEERRSGVHLFRAYVHRRAADKEKNEARKTQLNSKLAEWKPSDGYIEELAESLMLDILVELDPIIEGLLRFCEDPNSADDTLPKLRGVLRIGKGLSHYDVEQERTEKRGVYLWYKTYLAMRDGEIAFKSETATAKDIAKELNVSPRTALNYWERAQGENSVYKHWADDWYDRTRKAGEAGIPKTDQAEAASTPRKPRGR